MKVKAVAIESFAHLLLGSDIFPRVLRVVTRQADNDLTGEQKRAAAIEDFKTVGLELATWATNLAIELAVAWLKTQVQKQND